MTIAGSKLRRAAAQLPYLPRALRLVWEAAGRWTAGLSAAEVRLFALGDHFREAYHFGAREN